MSRSAGLATLGSLVSLAGGCSAAAPRVGPSAPPAALAQGDHTVVVDGVTLAYHVHGHGPVCIAHPGGPGLQWSYLRMPAVEADLTLVYLEPAGTGASSALPAYTLARYAELLEGFRAALGLPRPCVLGHSHGGYVVEHWAAAHPDHVGALILYATAGWHAEHEDTPGLAAYQAEPWFAAAMAARDREATITTDAEADALLAAEWPLLFADWTHHAEAYARAVAGVHAAVGPLHAAATATGGWDVRPGLAAVHAPALVIVGAKDWITPPVRAEEIAKSIPGATQVTLPASGHMGHVEEPAAFAAAIHGFAAKLPR